MENLPCLICSTTISETHCGFDVCRACAAFFKRTQNSGKRYICRQGNGQCEFRKHEKFTCRYCRYARCREIGMECIQETTSILNLIKREYDESVSRRLKEELKLIEKYRLKPVDGIKGIYQITLRYYYASYPVVVRDLRIFLRSLIPEFDQFSEHVKTSILWNVVGKFNALEFYYRTSKKFKDFGRCMSTLLTSFDVNECDDYLTEAGYVIRQKDMLSTKLSYARESLTLLYRTIRMGELTETEFHAFIAISLCEMDSIIDLPERINFIFENIRSKVFNELQDYYKNDLKIDNFSTRLGNLMSLSPVISEFHNICVEQLNLYSTLFDAKSQWELLREAMSRL